MPVAVAASPGNRRTKPAKASRRFYAWPACFILLLAVYSVFLRGPATARNHGALLQRRADAGDLELFAGEECRLVHEPEVVDKCAFVRRNCHDDEAGLIEYLTLYYCTLGAAKPLAFVLLVGWLGLLFTTIGIAASDFFSVNLSTIATVLGLSESLAGVTFLAFGNGSPDVFSTFAAMGSNSGSMAVGELIGAAGFITAVVAGSMALVREFKVNRLTFVRDICFFIAAVSFAVGFLLDGILHLWECFLMIGFYVFYVVFVVGWHTFSKSRSARKAREAAARGHVYASGAHGNEELEPYRDDPDDDDDIIPTPATVDVGVLERGPRIEVDDAHDPDDDRSQHVAAEVASSMRVTRPRGRRNTTTITPIRPSLVGALEFRSVLASLHDERNVHMGPIHSRSHSMDLYDSAAGGADGPRPLVRAPGSTHTVPTLSKMARVSRSRAQSTEAALPTILSPDLIDAAEPRSPSIHTVDGKLAPPVNHHGMGGRATEGAHGANAPPLAPPTGLKLQIPTPSPHGSQQSSPAVSPFPSYTESPLQRMTSNYAEPTYFMLPTPGAEQRRSSFPSSDLVEHEPLKPVRWWPYGIMPAPHILVSALFPTLLGWQKKTWWDKIVSLISVPSIFLLAITLPVVESETTDDDAASSVEEEPAHAHAHLGNTAGAVSFEPGGAIEPETEWQRYRRSTRSSRCSSASRTPIPRSPILVSQAAPGESPGAGLTATGQQPPVQQDAHTFKAGLELLPDASSCALALEDPGWNRWLLIVQTFMGPLFASLVIWANMAEELEHPGKVLVKIVLAVFLCSLALLGVLLLTTTPDHRPKYHFMFCFLGFIIAIAWISSVAGEVVGVLKAFGVILDISEALLGLTVFAIGNSVGDLFANITVARLGYPVMALSACFGGPMLNILLGIGLGGVYQAIQAANKKHKKHPERPVVYKPYHIQVGGTLLVSACVLLVGLLVLLIAVPMNKWVMNRRIGWTMIILWFVGTVANMSIEMTGAWADIA